MDALENEKKYKKLTTDGKNDAMTEIVVYEYLDEATLRPSSTVSEFMTMSSHESFVYEMERENMKKDRAYRGSFEDCENKTENQIV